MDQLQLAANKKQHRMFEAVGDQAPARDCNLIGNYTDAGLGKTLFYIRFPPDEVVIVTGMRLEIQSKPGENFITEGYGSLQALTNGIDIFTNCPPNEEQLLEDETHEGTKIFHFTRNQKIYKLRDYFVFCQGGYPPDISAREWLTPTWEAHEWRHEVSIDGQQGNYFAIDLNDDFSNLLVHKFHVFCITNKEAEVVH